MPDFRSYCIQFITNQTIYQISFRAQLGEHTISMLLHRGMDVYLPRYAPAEAAYLRANSLSGDYLYPYSRYLAMVQDYMTEFDLPCTHLTYSQTPADSERVWDLPGDLGYPVANAAEPWLESLGSPDELYLLIRLQENLLNEGEDLHAMESYTTAFRAVKDPAGGYEVKLIQQYTSYHADDSTIARNQTDLFTIAQFHSREEQRRELVKEYTLALSPFSGNMLLLLSHIDELTTVRQVGRLFGYND